MADRLTRRTTLASAAGLSIAVPVLAACGDGGGGGGTARDAGSAPTTPGSTTSAPATTEPSTGGAAAKVVGPVDDIEVGGGRIYGDLNLVVTRPDEGTVKGFDATCTHMGCQVAQVDGGTINCTCHFSRFSITDGGVEGGPAREPLPEKPVTVENGQIRLA